MRRLALWLGFVLLAGCDQNSDASVGWNTFWDLLGGEPDADVLTKRVRFEAAGVSFDHPAALRMRHEVDEDGDQTWSFEHGMFELELYAPKSGVRAADYLRILGDMFAGGRSVDSEPLTTGRSATLCGQALVATKLRLKMMGDWSEMEAFDLPAPPGEARILIFDDEPVDGQPSAVARATYEQVLGSVRCDASFMPKGEPAG